MKSLEGVKVTRSKLHHAIKTCLILLQVRLVNFHPFYQDDMPKRNAFYTNYDCITLPQDVMSRSNIVLNKVRSLLYRHA